MSPRWNVLSSSAESPASGTFVGSSPTTFRDGELPPQADSIRIAGTQKLKISFIKTSVTDLVVWVSRPSPSGWGGPRREAGAPARPGAPGGRRTRPTEVAAA